MKGNEPMNEEVKNALERMNEIQKSAIQNNGISKDEKEEFSACAEKVRVEGFSLRRNYIRNAFGCTIGCVWTAIKRRSDRFVWGRWEKDEHEKNHNTECTTRALYFVLNHEIPYQTIRTMQNEMAHDTFHRGRCYG